eukprot:7377629-Prymnesium_polylepis.1
MIRRHAVNVLRYLQPEDLAAHGPALLQRLTSDVHDFVKREAVQALGELEAVELEPHAQTLAAVGLTDGDRLVRVETLK